MFFINAHFEINRCYLTGWSPSNQLPGVVMCVARASQQGRACKHTHQEHTRQAAGEEKPEQCHGLFQHHTVLKCNVKETRQQNVSIVTRLYTRTAIMATGNPLALFYC